MESSKPLPYTTSPLRLIWVDTILFFRITLVLPITAGLLSIVLPVFPLRSGALDELYPSAANIYAITLHTILIIAQLGFIFSLLPPALCGLPVPFYAAYLIGFVAINHAVSGLLNGRPKSYTSQIDLSGWSSHDDEKWFFINGVAVGQTWLQNNLDRFALTFRRPIYGIQNYTRGIIFDVLECVIQRGFSYSTTDVRNGYAQLKHTLDFEPQYKKVVLIVHSQGAIEGGMILDWLYASVPASTLQRLEVYTFGNASNHWNCPQWSLENGNRKMNSGGSDDGEGENRVVKHIEHYAKSGDWVSRFGILHFRSKPVRADPTLPASRDNEEQNRFFGRLFIRHGSGHQLNGNYLDNMFEMEEDMSRVKDGNEFMDAWVDIDGFRGDNIVVAATKKVGGSHGNVRRVKDLSRLWKYRNGESA